MVTASLYVFLLQDIMVTIPIRNTRLKIIARFVIMVFICVVDATKLTNINGLKV